LCDIPIDNEMSQKFMENAMHCVLFAIVTIRA